ncbi:MAG: cupin domain-containing protein [Candidatus Pacebacteria bacterium]|nr:cupin domain-containing protein [Candidatus Paceibacterota bacterium]
MKIIHKNQTEQFKNSENCIATEYPMSDKDINGAVVELTGRYPEKGRVVNLKCKELVYVIKGYGMVIIEDKELKLEEGDLVLIEPGERYFFDGNLTIFIACNPAWHNNQYKEAE